MNQKGMSRRITGTAIPRIPLSLAIWLHIVLSQWIKQRKAVCRINNIPLRSSQTALFKGALLTTCVHMHIKVMAPLP
jgi:hypothetical protein